MKSLTAAIVLTALALLMSTSRAAESTGHRGYIPARPLLGIGATDPRIRVDPHALPWRAVKRLQAVSMNLRALCVATLGRRATKSRLRRTRLGTH